MKHLITLFICSFLFAETTQAQCNDYFAYGEGDFFEHTTYNARGKEQNVQRMTVKEVVESGDVVTYKINASSSKGESYEMEFSCEGGDLKFDGQQLIKSAMQQPEMEGMEISYEGDVSSYPSDLVVGNELEDNVFKMTMKGAMEGVSIDVITSISIENRKVVGKEQVTTEAGTFDSFKITYDMVSTSEVMGMNNSSKTSSIEYIAPRVGVVRSETFDSSGQLMFRNELTMTSL